MLLYHYTNKAALQKILKEGFKCSSFDKNGHNYLFPKLKQKVYKPVCVVWFLDRIGAKKRLPLFSIGTVQGRKIGGKYLIIIDVPKSRILLKERSPFDDPVWYYILMGKVSKKYIVDVVKL